MTRTVARRPAPKDLAWLAPLLTVEDVARALQVTDRTVRRWFADGSLPFVRAGGRVRVLRSDLVAFLRRGTPARTR